MLTFDGVTLRRGTRELFADVTFTIFAGEKVGIAGANGSGKSSLLALVRGELEPDAGRVALPRDTVIAHVAQEIVDSDAAALEFVLDGDTALRATERALNLAETRGDGVVAGELHAAYDALGGYEARSRAARLMHGLGFAPQDCDLPVRRFSGGWRVRLALARALMCRSDLLLLDEPTNHLDLDAISWLEEWLRGYRGTLLVIAHDREFLDGIVGRIAHLEENRLTLYTGNYTAFETARAERLARQTALYERQQREIARLGRFIERFRAKATKARQARSRARALGRMERIAAAHVDSPFSFAFDAPPRLPTPLLTIEDQACGYDDRIVVEGIDLSLSAGDRIALLGRNGAGKSTVMKLIAGAILSPSGTRAEARDLAIGYFAQLEMEQLDPDRSALEQLRLGGAPEAAQAPEQALRAHLGRFGFPGERVFEPVGPFSGGEKARLVLALLAHRRPNLLLLDEPTNHLDLEMRDALALALQEYPGAVVLVSHDRHLVRMLADRLYVVAAGRFAEFEGDIDDYGAVLRARDVAPGGEEPRAKEPSNRKTQRRESARRREELGPLRRELERVEHELARLTKERAEIESELARPETYGNDASARVRELATRRAGVDAAIRRLEDAWLAAGEALERAQSQKDS